jgi:hypothetical protein
MLYVTGFALYFVPVSTRIIWFAKLSGNAKPVWQMDGKFFLD